jgi:hypothetical protein
VTGALAAGAGAGPAVRVRVRVIDGPARRGRKRPLVVAHRPATAAPDAG